MLRLLPTNPLVVRLVQGGSRRTPHMYIRAAYLAVLIVTLLALLLPGSQGTNIRDLAANAANAFEIVAYLQIGLVCVLAPVFMAGAIAQESNPRTWDILLTTPLSAAQIVLGTLFGRLFFVLALLVASLPLFAVTQVFGGVPGSSVLASYAVTASAAVLVGAIAVALAVNRLAGRRAVFAFYVSVITYLAVTLVLDAQLTSPWGGVTWATPINPFLALRALLNPFGYPRPEGIDLAGMGAAARFWYGSPVTAWCVLSLGLSALLVGVSTLTIRQLSSKTGARRRVAGDREARTVASNPIAWRESTARAAGLGKSLARWGFLAAGLLWGVGLLVVYHNGSITHEEFRLLLLATAWTELIVITLVAINMSATAISREREDGTLDLLLTTPITPAEYLGGKLLGVVLFVSPLLAVPILTVAAASAYALLGGFGRAGGVEVPTRFGTASPVDLPVVLPELGLLLPLVVVPFVAFCVMVGLSWSLKSKGTIGSVVATVAVVGVIGGIVGLCGWVSAENIPLIGPALSALNPVTILWSLVEPGVAFGGEAVSHPSDLPQARFGVAAGAIAAIALYTAVVFAMRTSMVRTFDVTTRKLAGNH